MPHAVNLGTYNDALDMIATLSGNLTEFNVTKNAGTFVAGATAVFGSNGQVLTGRLWCCCGAIEANLGVITVAGNGDDQNPAPILDIASVSDWSIGGESDSMFDIRRL